MLGSTELLVVAGAIVLLFGASKIPQLGGAIGEGIRNFKKGLAEDPNKDDGADKKFHPDQ